MTDLRPEPNLAVSIRRCRAVWHAQRYTTSAWTQWGESGFMLRIQQAENGTVGTLIVSQAIIDGDDWIHASMSWPDRIPTYEELALLHRSVFGPKRWAYQVFATEDKHVNFHANALHLWGRADGANLLPDFGRYGMV